MVSQWRESSQSTQTTADSYGDHVQTRRRSVAVSDAAYPDWEAIYTHNVARIYRLMFMKVGNRADAEDLTSQVFLAAYGPLQATASIGQVRAYLTATARTVLAEHWRRTLGHQVTEIDVDSADLEEFTHADAMYQPADSKRRANERAARILRALPERQRQILVLRFLRGYSVRQAAAELGISVSNAKVLQHRALRAAAGLETEGEDA
jgi:RNA polymerase sigma-70 factor (ECF subfamily)